MGRLIHEAKNYGDDARIILDEQIHELAKLALWSVACSSTSTEIDMIVPMPSSRGIEGNTLPSRIAHQSSAETGVPVAPDGIVKFTRQISEAKHTNHFWVKKQMLQGSTTAKSEIMAGRTLLVVDDLCQTGITLEEAARSCREAGANEVLVLALSKTLRNHEYVDRSYNAGIRTREQQQVKSSDRAGSHKIGKPEGLTAMSDARALIALMMVVGVAPAKIANIVKTLSESQTEVGYLLEYAANDLVGEELLDGDQAERFVSSDVQRQVAEWFEQLEERGVQTIPLTSERYPPQLLSSLGTAAPPVLFVQGSIELLHDRAVAFSGARDVSEEGIEHTKNLAKHVVGNGHTVVSGGARGTDSAAHAAANQHGGKKVLVLSEGIFSKRETDISGADDPRHVAVVSTFLPDAIWKSFRAMERNTYILGLSERLIVIEAGEKGGTIAAGQTSLKMKKPTWVLDYAKAVPTAAGNASLIKRGARAIPVSASNELLMPDDLLTSGIVEVAEIDTVLQPSLLPPD